MALCFVTTNEGKVREAREYLTEPVEQVAVDTVEIQSDDLGAVAAHKARQAHREVGGPVFVEDAGLFVDALGGFPGPYSAYVEDTLGVERVWRLVEREDPEDRTASFRGVIAYCDGADFEATPEPVDREDRRGQDLAAAERGAATTDDQVRDDATGRESEAPPVKLFEGVVPGRIVAPRGDGGFGYDPIFEYGGTTFAEMDAERKNAVSQRGRALERFAEWLAETDRDTLE